MRAADGGPDQPQASSQCRARPERQVLSQPTAFPVRELSPGRFGASPAPSPRCAQERSPPICPSGILEVRVVHARSLCERCNRSHEPTVRADFWDASGSTGGARHQSVLSTAGRSMRGVDRRRLKTGVPSPCPATVLPSPGRTTPDVSSEC